MVLTLYLGYKFQQRYDRFEREAIDHIEIGLRLKKKKVYKNKIMKGYWENNTQIGKVFKEDSDFE